MPAAFYRRRWSNPKPTVSLRLIALATGLIRFSPLVPLTNTALAAFYIILGGGGWIRTTEARASDLQSDPFGHSGTPPEGRTFSRCQGRVSTLNFTLKIPLYACVCPRFEKCVRAVVIFAPGSPQRLGSGGLQITRRLGVGTRYSRATAAVVRGTKEKNVSRKNGAGERNRTPDRLITNQLLYLLSYAS
jgi:hypothetical protein